MNKIINPSVAISLFALVIFLLVLTQAPQIQKRAQEQYELDSLRISRFIETINNGVAK